MASSVLGAYVRSIYSMIFLTLITYKIWPILSWSLFHKSKNFTLKCHLISEENIFVMVSSSNWSIVKMLECLFRDFQILCISKKVSIAVLDCIPQLCLLLGHFLWNGYQSWVSVMSNCRSITFFYYSFLLLYLTRTNCP